MPESSDVVPDLPLKQLLERGYTWDGAVALRAYQHYLKGAGTEPAVVLEVDTPPRGRYVNGNITAHEFLIEVAPDELEAAGCLCRSSRCPVHGP